jgi:hypothetical protein
MLLYCVLAATGAPKRQDFFALLDAQDVGEARRGVACRPW